MTVTPDGQQRRVDPGPGRGIHLPLGTIGPIEDPPQVEEQVLLRDVHLNAAPGHLMQ